MNIHIDMIFKKSNKKDKNIDVIGKYDSNNLEDKDDIYELSKSKKYNKIGRNNAKIGLNLIQINIIIISLIYIIIACLKYYFWNILHFFLCFIFIFINFIKIIACFIAINSKNNNISYVSNVDFNSESNILPKYTIILALYKESRMVPQLLDAIGFLNYPKDHLQIIAALEKNDIETLEAFKLYTEKQNLSESKISPEIVFSENIGPQTKPRALNTALQHSQGDIIVVYDAEDRPHPNQLLEASDIFIKTGSRTGVVQAPLRITEKPKQLNLLGRQFALDYAALFEVWLPFLTRIGFPIPLGGSSNHIRKDVLLKIKGWDSYNVTEDADLGFFIGRAGYETVMISSATLETPPITIKCWLKQRSRWIKGHLQTLAVHSKDFRGLGYKGSVSLLITLGSGLLSSVIHGPVLIFLAIKSASYCLGWDKTGIYFLDMFILAFGWITALIMAKIGQKKAGQKWNIVDFLFMPFYWGLLSIALIRALAQLITNPYLWDKTEHYPVKKSGSGTSEHTVACPEITSICLERL